jgi:hypothetical protein
MLHLFVLQKIKRKLEKVLLVAKVKTVPVGILGTQIMQN